MHRSRPNPSRLHKKDNTVGKEDRSNKPLRSGLGTPGRLTAMIGSGLTSHPASEASRRGRVLVFEVPIPGDGREDVGNG